MINAIIFDMDGTLWDSVDEIVESWNRAISGLGVPDVTVTRERMLGLVGMTMDRFAKEFFPQYPMWKGMAFMDQMERTENEYLEEHGARLLGDVEGTFRALRERGCFIGIVSNSQSGYIEAFLHYYHLEEFVDGCLSYGDTLEGKANNLRVLIRKNGLNPAQCLYVGDTDGDRDACAKAGVSFVWASYGFGTVEGEVARIDSLEELPALVDAMNRDGV